MSAPGKPDTVAELLDTLDELHGKLRPLLTVATYVASSHAVLDAINGATRWDKTLEKRMFELHPTWRDPDSDGEVLGALAELLMQGEGALFSAHSRAEAVRRGGEQ